MFEEARLLGRTERSIALQTGRGTDIKNVVQPEPGDAGRRRYQLLLDKFGGNWRPRRPATGIYNCAGHVWASRRTAILEDDQWALILHEDGYRRLEEDEEPVPDDLVIYIDVGPQKESFLHVGRVFQLRPGVIPASRRIPWVVSKWDSFSGEVLHDPHDVPYARQGFVVRREYWTDRPMPARG